MGGAAVQTFKSADDVTVVEDAQSRLRRASLAGNRQQMPCTVALRTLVPSCTAPAPSIPPLAQTSPPPPPAGFTTLQKSRKKSRSRRRQRSRPNLTSEKMDKDTAAATLIRIFLACSLLHVGASSSSSSSRFSHSNSCLVDRLRKRCSLHHVTATFLGPGVERPLCHIPLFSLADRLSEPLTSG